MFRLYFSIFWNKPPEGHPHKIPLVESIPLVILAFGAVSASLRRVGRKTAARAYDAMIAAIAVANDLPVYTCNPDDFTGIERLEVIAVPVPA